MKQFKSRDLYQIVLTATNKYGVVHLFVKSDRVPTKSEAIQLMIDNGMWMDEDEIGISVGVNEVTVFFDK